MLTVPASFDEIAREFTLRSVKMAGLKNVTLLEELKRLFTHGLLRIRRIMISQKHYQIISQTPKILS